MGQIYFWFWICNGFASEENENHIHCLLKNIAVITSKESFWHHSLSVRYRTILMREVGSVEQGLILVATYIAVLQTVEIHSLKWRFTCKVFKQLPMQ
jgi:hypothetical protein